MTVGFLGGKFLPFHLGHVYMTMAASNMVDKLYVVLSSSENRDKELCERDEIKYMPANVRMSWIGECLNDLDNIEIINVVDDQWDADYNWEEGSKKIIEAIPEKITHVFSSEHEYDRHFSVFYPDAEHIVVDAGREIVNISATELRKDLFMNWDMLPNTVRAFFTKKVVILGTESCGKSTLVKKLAKTYNTNCVEEVGREYCVRYKNQLTQAAFNSIAMDHYRLQEEKACSSNKVLFVDSEAVTTLYYLEMYLDKESAVISEIAKLQKYDLAIYLEPDVEWVADGYRFAENDRAKHNARLKQMFMQYGIDYVTISGDYQNRYERSTALVNKMLWDL